MATQASACLTISGHGAMGLDNQALAGAMKPNLCVEQDLLSGGFWVVETP
jgi:hypothetical protein